jgi:hypothetical protein
MLHAKRTRIKVILLTKEIRDKTVFTRVVACSRVSFKLRSSCDLDKCSFARASDAHQSSDWVME